MIEILCSFSALSCHIQILSLKFHKFKCRNLCTIRQITKRFSINLLESNKTTAFTISSCFLCLSFTKNLILQDKINDLDWYIFMEVTFKYLGLKCEILRISFPLNVRFIFRQHLYEQFNWLIACQPKEDIQHQYIVPYSVNNAQLVGPSGLKRFMSCQHKEVIQHQCIKIVYNASVICVIRFEKLSRYCP